MKIKDEDSTTEGSEDFCSEVDIGHARVDQKDQPDDGRQTEESVFEGISTTAPA
jgi:hypothetical protein